MTKAETAVENTSELEKGRSASTVDAVNGGRHIPRLDGLRGLAILLVLVHHFSPEPDTTMSRFTGHILKLLAEGRSGVDLFFVLSGFLITGILLNTKQDPGYFSKFYMRRILRIFPLYYGVILFAIFIPSLIRPSYIQCSTAWLWLYGTNIACYLQIPIWPTHFWSLAVEEHFYLVWPLLVWLCSRRVLGGACVGFMVMAIVVRAVLASLTVDTNYFIYYLTPCRMDQLAVGGLITILFRGPWRYRLGDMAKYAIIPTMGILALLYMTTTELGNPILRSPKLTLIAMIFALLMILVMVASPRSILGLVFNHPVMRSLGKYSYGIYVFHAMITGPFDRWLPLRDIQIFYGNFAVAVVVRMLFLGMVSYAIAWLSWHLYEKHFLNLKRFFDYRKVSETSV